MNNREKIVEKLRKLMNLKESAQALGNEGEANAAAAGITRLLMEYNLTVDDIPDKDKIDNPIVSEEINYRTEMENGKWYFNLVNAICKYNMSTCLIVSNRINGRMKRDKLQIIGRKKNVEVVLYLTSFLANQFVNYGRKGYSQYKHDCIWKLNIYPLTQNKYIKSFLYGCVCGLVSKLEETIKSLSNEFDLNALVLATSNEIENFLNGEKIGKARFAQTSIDRFSAQMGEEVGYNIEITKGINATAVSEERRLH
jgi:hypothetical protein